MKKKGVGGGGEGGRAVTRKSNKLTAPQLPHFLPPPEMPVPHFGQLLWPMVASMFVEQVWLLLLGSERFDR